MTKTQKLTITFSSNSYWYSMRNLASYNYVYDLHESKFIKIVGVSTTAEGNYEEFEDFNFIGNTDEVEYYLSSTKYKTITIPK